MLAGMTNQQVRHCFCGDQTFAGLVQAEVERRMANQPGVVSAAPPSLELFQERAALLAQHITDQQTYLELLAPVLAERNISAPLPETPAFSPRRVTPSSVTPEVLADLEKDLSRLESNVSSQLLFLQKLEIYLTGNDQLAQSVASQSHPVALYFPAGTVEERLGRIQGLLLTMDQDYRAQRSYLKIIERAVKAANPA